MSRVQSVRERIRESGKLRRGIARKQIVEILGMYEGGLTEERLVSKLDPRLEEYGHLEIVRLMRHDFVNAVDGVIQLTEKGIARRNGKRFSWLDRMIRFFRRQLT